MAELLVVYQLSVASVDVIALQVAGRLLLVCDAARGGQQHGVLARVLNHLEARARGAARLELGHTRWGKFG